MPNQDFWLDIYVVPFTGHIIGTAPVLPTVANWSITAVSAGYWTSALSNAQGAYTLLLPAGNYMIYAQKQCYMSYPAYLSKTVAGSPVLNQNFKITGWQICDRCYATLYSDMLICAGLGEGREECELEATAKFRRCAIEKTMDATSDLYNATILSIEVQRGKGQPQEDVKTFTVDTEGDYWVNISNGDYFNVETAVSAADIAMSVLGPLFGPSDFNKKVFLLKKEVHLTPGEYSISTILYSQPGSYLTIVISDKDIASFPELP